MELAGQLPEGSLIVEPLTGFLEPNSWLRDIETACQLFIFQKLLVVTKSAESGMDR